MHFPHYPSLSFVFSLAKMIATLFVCYITVSKSQKNLIKYIQKATK